MYPDFAAADAIQKIQILSESFLNSVQHPNLFGSEVVAMPLALTNVSKLHIFVNDCFSPPLGNCCQPYFPRDDCSQELMPYRVVDNRGWYRH